ncbi:hypothetical protein P3T76_010092 [Phytophthora citrophthora]|uniref:Uncharacterized protein n=1 Tax=Phytophthora citrophthora TaxID=4793 RepID=A0AAD9GE20_9STRA|nr:hypothetical protein P3T76_010092 [Phytophthora citrophthora]
MPSTGHLQLHDFVTAENSVEEDRVKYYSELNLLVKITVPDGSWTVNYMFQLEPISLEYFYVLEAKVRAVEEELSARKAGGSGEESDVFGGDR